MGLLERQGCLVGAAVARTHTPVDVDINANDGLEASRLASLAGCWGR